ncbi:MAG TPA: hypothetical protein VGR67_12365 [Candidatus Polarisedimenticolia bacterium]|jgi:hypothetical protein|nr:hypothetical protein [Candidatus Polarisedimenticolia bacterium]
MTDQESSPGGPTRRRWKTVIGVLGVIFGSFGVMSATQVALTPLMLEWQRKFIATIQTQASQQGSGQTFGAVAAMFEQFLAPAPWWFTPWCIGLGLVSLAVSAFYLFSAIWLILHKPSAPRCFCVAMIASISTVIARIAGLMMARGMWGLMMGLGAVFGIVIDLVLLLIVLAHRSEWSEGTPIGAPGIYS